MKLPKNIDAALKYLQNNDYQDSSEISIELKKYIVHLLEINEKDKNELLQLRDEVIRLKKGNFTKDEVHNFCHDFPANIVSLDEFANGCQKEMILRYGKCPFKLD